MRWISAATARASRRTCGRAQDVDLVHAFIRPGLAALWLGLVRADVQDGDRHAARPRDQADEARGKAAVAAAVGGEQDALHVRHERAALVVLPLQSLLF